MTRRLVVVIAVGQALSGCCPGIGCYIPPPTSGLTSWDGLGPLPGNNNVKRAKVRKPSVAVASEDNSPREEDLVWLRPYSKEWGAVRDAIDRDADAKLKEKLIICRGCMPPEQDDQTGSIARK